MSDEVKRMERALEQITAPAAAPRRDLPPEAQRLRDAWLAFGQLLEAADVAGTGHHASMVGVPSAPVAGTGHTLGVVDEPLIEPRHTERACYDKAQSRRPLILAAAAAAALLLAVGIYWACCGPGGSAVVPVAPDKMVTAPVQDQNKSAPSNHVVRQSTAAAGDLKWDDKLDEQIQQTAQAATLAQNDGLRGVDVFDAMGYEVERTRQDFEKSEL
jgi:hypothetical protein